MRGSFGSWGLYPGPSTLVVLAMDRVIGLTARHLHRQNALTRWMILLAECAYAHAVDRLQELLTAGAEYPHAALMRLWHHRSMRVFLASSRGRFLCMMKRRQASELRVASASVKGYLSR